MNLAWAKNKIKHMASVLRPSAFALNNTVAKGYLSVYKEYSDGSRELVLDNDPNTITYDSRRLHLKALYQQNPPIDILTSFKVGSGGAVGSDTGGNTNIKVRSPDPTRNDLYTPIDLVNKEIQIVESDPVELPNEVYLQILFTLSQDEANGLLINECGLFKNSGDMFNHKTFNSIPKNDSFSLIFDWKIRYVS